MVKVDTTKADTMWDPRAERMSADERAELQSRRLDDLVGRLAERSPRYRERLVGAGVGRGGRVGLHGLADLPFTTKQDLWDAYPWGLPAVPREQVVGVHGSSGTGGRPTWSPTPRRPGHLGRGLRPRPRLRRRRPRGPSSTTPTATGCSPAVWARTPGPS